MRALLVQPWIVDFAAYDLWIRPLGLLYIAGRLRQAGLDVSLLDCLDRSSLNGEASPSSGLRQYGTGRYHREPLPRPACLNPVSRTYSRYGLPLDTVRSMLAACKRPDIVLVGSGMTYWYPGVQEMIALLRDRFGDVPVLLGGIYATLATDHARLHSGADMVVAGEAEPTVLRTLADLLQSPEPAAPVCDDLNTYPEPAMDLLCDRRVLPLLTTRGCPYRCTFCASHRVSGEFRRRRPEDVADEVIRWHRTYGTTDFVFYDDALLIQTDRHLLPILETIIQAGVQVRFHTPNGLFAARITPEVARLMRRAGFTTIRLSLETVNPERKQDIGRKVTPESFATGVEALLQAGYQATELDVYLIMGLPGQSVEEVIHSIRYCSRLGVKVRLAAFSPIPGTAEWQRACTAGELREDDDLLLTNNTLLPLRSPRFTWQVVEALRHWVAALNATPPDARRHLLESPPFNTAASKPVVS